MIKEKNELYERLINIFGPERVKMDTLERLLYSHDLAPLPKEVSLVFKMRPDAVVRPINAMEISKLVKFACEERIPITPRGGASWGLGGCVPCMGGIVLDMTSMNHILRLDTDNMEVEVEAGANWKMVYDSALTKGLLIGSYPSSAPGATIAGWIGTAGVGVGSYKYGSVGSYIRNMEVVLPEGQIIETGFNGVSDHSSGYNLSGLMVGSEGTLGIITKVTLKAFPAPEVLRPISIQYDTLFEAHPLMMALAKESITPLYISFSDEHHMAFLKRLGKSTPGDGALLNVTLEGSRRSVELEAEVIEKLISHHGGVKLPNEVAEHEWHERSYEFRTRNTGLGTIPGEIMFPLKRFPKVVKETYELINIMKMEASILGTMSDRSSVAFLPYFFYNEKKFIKTMTALSFNKKLGDIGFKNQGRPLGLGLFFASNLSKIRGKDAANTMFDIKSVMDPYDILNPGKTIEGLIKHGAPIPGVAMNLGMDAMSAVKAILPKDREFHNRTKENS